MISRRSFLKLSGLAALGLGAGYGAGKLIKPEGEKYFAVHGFLPDDELVVKNIVRVFAEKTKGSNAALYADAKWSKVIANALNSSAKQSVGNFTIRMTKINSSVNGDILVTDNNTVVYDPASDFNASFSKIRSEIMNSKAEYLFTAEYKESSIFSGLFGTNEKFAVIENQFGVYDKISLKNSYKDIYVNGKQGKTGIRIENGFVNVHTAACRHETCKNLGAISNVGDVIACAPNRVIIRVV